MKNQSLKIVFYVFLTVVLFVSCKKEKPEEEKRKMPEETIKELKINTGIAVIDRLADEMIFIKGGTFAMGANAGDVEAASDEYPQHNVTLSSFRIGKYEVTQELWQAVMATNPSYFKGEKLPVESVSWNDCQEFIVKLNEKTGLTFRLPTEAEWEYAARGGKKANHCKYAGEDNLERIAWWEGNSNNQTHEVGTKDTNELGLCDMSGNVWEWCQDWYGAYTENSQSNPKGANNGTARVRRGGSWGNNAQSCRVNFRQCTSPEKKGGNLGFRLAL